MLMVVLSKVRKQIRLCCSVEEWIQNSLFVVKSSCSSAYSTLVNIIFTVIATKNFGLGACLVVNPITVGNFAFLFNCTLVGQTSDSRTVSA